MFSWKSKEIAMGLEFFLRKMLGHQYNAEARKGL